MHLRHVRQAVVIFILQFILFLFLFVVGFVCGLIYMIDDCVPNACYFSTHARLAKLETTSAVDCSNPTNSICSRQMRIYIYFFKVKMLIIYYSSIIIVYMAPHCPLVVLFSCFICYHSCRFWYTSYSLF